MYKLFCSVRVLRRNSSLQYFLVCDCCSLSSGREVLVRVIVGLEEVVVLGKVSGRVDCFLDCSIDWDS